MSGPSPLMATYPEPPITLVRGEGTRVWDTDGNEYLDWFGGIGVQIELRDDRVVVIIGVVAASTTAVAGSSPFGATKVSSVMCEFQQCDVPKTQVSMRFRNKKVKSHRLFILKNKECPRWLGW